MRSSRAVQMYRPDSLPGALLEKWRAVRNQNPCFASPYFDPSFCDIVSRVMGDVELAVIDPESAEPGFFAFQRRSRRIGIPVGGILSDYHGIVAPQGRECDLVHLMKACGLTAWDFDHLPVGSQSFEPFCTGFDSSPTINLARGFEAYSDEVSVVRAERRTLLKAARELGEIRLVFESQDTGALTQVLSWKSRQYVRSGKRDLMAVPWIEQTLSQVHQTCAEEFCGVLSLLYAGDRMIAGHLGMRSRHVLHYWFPSYDEAYAKYSPGTILLILLAKEAALRGITLIDLGKGSSFYKRRFMNGSVALASGSVMVPSFLAVRRRLKRMVRAGIRRMPGARQVKRFMSRVCTTHR